MAGIVKLLGIYMVAIGAVYLVKASIMKKFLQFWLKGKRYYLGGILSFAVGILLLIASGACQWKGFVIFFGVAAIFKGVLLFALGEQKIKVLMQYFTKMSTSRIRIMGLVSIGMGALLIYAV
jgi:uncharacterized protein YjeT (DUF2065 family)